MLFINNYLAIKINFINFKIINIFNFLNKVFFAKLHIIQKFIIQYVCQSLNRESDMTRFI